ncbi:MAG: ABC transporter permease subunit [Kiritimatiellae bacterium]|nr:ABC transporter permease subunit [Kiritimatiellia bacterium]
MKSIKNTLTVTKRELKSYFESPVAYVFLIAFLVLTGFLTFTLSGFFERQVADLQPFFLWHPWVYLLLIPAATMGVWAEERRTGTIEILLTMPVTMLQAIMGKFIAAWLFIILALTLTFPIAAWTCWLGNPDIGVMICGYIGSALLAGSYVAIGMLMSSLTKSQVIGFVLSLMVSFLLLLAGWPPITDFFTNWIPSLVGFVAAFSFMPHFDSIQRGVIDVRDIVYFLSIMVFMIFATHIVLENRKSA